MWKTFLFFLEHRSYFLLGGSRGGEDLGVREDEGFSTHDMSVCTWGISARRGAGYHASSSFTDSFHFRLFLGAWASGLWLSWGFWYGYLVVGWYMGGVTDSVKRKS